MLNRALNIHAAAEKPKDREWIHVLLHFLRAYVEDMGRQLLMSEEDSAAYVQGLATQLQAAAQELDTGMRRLLIFLWRSSLTGHLFGAETPFPDHPAFALSLAEHDAQLAETRDGSLLKVVVQNKLPCVRPVTSMVRCDRS